MASTITLKRRIGSIKNTRQITRAMQLVSASKMRRAQEHAAASRPYSELAYSILQRLNEVREVASEPLFKSRDKVVARLYVVVTSNSGLAGAYNANVLKQLSLSLQSDRDERVASKVIVIGNKGAQFVRRLQNVELLAVYNNFGDNPTVNDLRPILNTLVEQYEDASVDEVQLIYTQFKTNILQVAQKLQLLPASFEDKNKDGKADRSIVTTFEPDPETVISQIAVRLVEAQLWQALLESIASEHSMRMLAMKNATDNAKELIDDYTLELNTARQAAITQELAEITGGAEALNG